MKMVKIDRLSAVIYFFLFVMTALFIYLAYRYIAHYGQYSVNFVSGPRDATLKLNGQELSSRHIYLAPGSYQLTVSQSPFADKSRQISVGPDSPATFYITVDASSDNNQYYLRNHADIEADMEEVGGLEANQLGQLSADDNPLTSQLPCIASNYDFRIDYGDSNRQKSPTAVAYYVSAATAATRQEAIDWLKQKGVDVSQQEIIFTDFQNPLASGVAQ